MVYNVLPIAVSGVQSLWDIVSAFLYVIVEQRISLEHNTVILLASFEAGDKQFASYILV